MKTSVRLAAAALFMSACLSGCGDSERYKAEEKFGPINKKMMAAVGDLTAVPAKTELVAEPYVKGKIAVFQARGSKGSAARDNTYFMQIDYFRELEAFYAATPEEVGTVALMHCKTTQKGTYKTDDGKEFPAEAEDCELTMVDRSKAAVVYKKLFEKTPSQERKAYGNTMVRESAQTDILQFLKGLPRT
ncbi:MAG TPA: hypothetical protein VF240_13795 [Pyrinomonadaceae bacterium]